MENFNYVNIFISKLELMLWCYEIEIRVEDDYIGTKEFVSKLHQTKWTQFVGFP
jgi:hypothetical protein